MGRGCHTDEVIPLKDTVSSGTEEKFTSSQFWRPRNMAPCPQLCGRLLGCVPWWMTSWCDGKTELENGSGQSFSLHSRPLPGSNGCPLEPSKSLGRAGPHGLITSHWARSLRVLPPEYRGNEEQYPSPDCCSMKQEK